MCLLGCNLSSNNELVGESKKFIDNNKGYLSDIAKVLDDTNVQKHRRILIYQGSANSVWDFNYDSLHYPNDTVPIDPIRIKSWNSKRLLVGVNFNIGQNEVIYEVAGINNKNDRSALLLFYPEPVALSRYPSCHSMKEDSNSFNALDNFTCALDSHWALLSRQDY